VIILAISTAHTASQLNALGYSYPMIPGSPSGASINSTYGIPAYPTTIVIAPNRSIVVQDIWPISNTILRNAITGAGGVPTTCPSAAIEEEISETVQLFPNPVSDILTITTEFELQIEMFDMTGKLVDSFNAAGSKSYDCSHLGTGIYMIRAIDSEGQLVAVKKFMKN
jgi:hypothetical protein